MSKQWTAETGWVEVIQGGSGAAAAAIPEPDINTVKPDVTFGTFDTRWQHYGLTEAPILFKGTDGKQRPTGRKGIFRDNALAADVSHKYTLLPNEEVLSLLGAAGFNPTQVYRSRGGNAIHAQVLEDKTDRNTHEIVEGDSVKVGVMVRNSIDGSLAFGGDIFTYRLLCSNGAIARGAELGSFTYKHLGEREKLTASVKDMIERVLNAGTELIATYRMAAEISLNQQFADQLAKTYIPDVYIPKYIDMKDRTKPKLTAAAQSVSLWQAFNYMTKEMWHTNRASMITKMRHEQELHKVLTIAVRGRN